MWELIANMNYYKSEIKSREYARQFKRLKDLRNCNPGQTETL